MADMRAEASFVRRDCDRAAEYAVLVCDDDDFVFAGVRLVVCPASAVDVPIFTTATSARGPIQKADFLCTNSVPVVEPASLLTNCSRQFIDRKAIIGASCNNAAASTGPGIVIGRPGRRQQRKFR
ncbi:MAG TPA: hypothetical protein VH497_06420 [Vicinamibacterales bacterium]